MSVHFGGQDFSLPVAKPMFAIVNPIAPERERGIAIHQTKLAGLVAGLRRALNHARAQSCPIAFVRNAARSDHVRWIRGFEPLRTEMLFERTQPSCYSARYFSEAVEAAGGTLVLAGAFHRGTIETAQSALRAGHRVICLRDAIQDVYAREFDDHVLTHMAKFTEGQLCVTTSLAWMRTRDRIGMS